MSQGGASGDQSASGAVRASTRASDSPRLIFRAKLRILLSIDDRRLKNRQDLRSSRLCARNRLHQQEAGWPLPAPAPPASWRDLSRPRCSSQRSDEASTSESTPPTTARSTAPAPKSREAAVDHLGHAGVAGHRERTQVDRLLPTGERRRSLEQRLRVRALSRPARDVPPESPSIDAISCRRRSSSAISSKPVCWPIGMRKRHIERRFEPSSREPRIGSGDPRTPPARASTLGRRLRIRG